MPQSARWQDPSNEYRVLYFSDTEFGAYVETLQCLRPHSATVAGVESILDDGGYPGFGFDMRTAITEKLHNRRLSSFIPGNPTDVVVDLEQSFTRTHLESIPKIAALLSQRSVKVLKLGDFSAGDYTLTNEISRAVYEDACQYSGLRCRSAEDQSSTNYTIFETGRETNVSRATLIESQTVLSLYRQNLLSASMQRLGIDRESVLELQQLSESDMVHPDND